MYDVISETTLPIKKIISNIIKLRYNIMVVKGVRQQLKLVPNIYFAPKKYKFNLAVIFAFLSFAAPHGLDGVRLTKTTRCPQLPYAGGWSGLPGPFGLVKHEWLYLQSPKDH